MSKNSLAYDFSRPQCLLNGFKIVIRFDKSTGNQWPNRFYAEKKRFHFFSHTMRLALHPTSKLCICVYVQCTMKICAGEQCHFTVAYHITSSHAQINYVWWVILNCVYKYFINMLRSIYLRLHLKSNNTHIHVHVIFRIERASEQTMAILMAFTILGHLSI